MQIDEIENCPKSNSVDDVTDRAAEDQADREGRNFSVETQQPDEQAARNGDSDSDQCPTQAIAALIEKAETDASVPYNDEVREGQNLNSPWWWQTTEKAQDIKLRRLIGDQTDKGDDQAKSGEAHVRVGLRGGRTNVIDGIGAA